MSIKDAEWYNKESSSRTLHLGTRSINKFLCIPQQNSRDHIPHGAVEEPTTETGTHGERSLCYLWVAVLQDRQGAVRRGHKKMLALIYTSPCSSCSWIWLCVYCCHCWGHRCPCYVPSYVQQNLLTYKPEMWNKGSLTWSLSRVLDMIKLSHAWWSECNTLIGTFCMHAFCLYILLHYHCIRWPVADDSLWNVSKSDKAHKEAFTKLGRSWEVSEELSKKLQESIQTTSSQINFHLVRTVSLGYRRTEMFWAFTICPKSNRLWLDNWWRQESGSWVGAWLPCTWYCATAPLLQVCALMYTTSVHLP